MGMLCPREWRCFWVCLEDRSHRLGHSLCAVLLCSFLCCFREAWSG